MQNRFSEANPKPSDRSTRSSAQSPAVKHNTYYSICGQPDREEKNADWYSVWLRHRAQECRELMVDFLMLILCILRCFQWSAHMSPNLLDCAAKAKHASMMRIDEVKPSADMILLYHWNSRLNHSLAFDISQDVRVISGERSTASWRPAGARRFQTVRQTRGISEVWPCVTCRSPQAPPKLFEAKGKERRERLTDVALNIRKIIKSAETKVKCHSARRPRSSQVTVVHTGRPRTHGKAFCFHHHCIAFSNVISHSV